MKQFTYRAWSPALKQHIEITVKAKHIEQGGSMVEKITGCNARQIELIAIEGEKV